MSKERPIIFRATMVRALLDGSKTQTRRVISDRHLRQISTSMGPRSANWSKPMPYGQPGDRLWVRENFDFLPSGGPDEPQACEIVYWATGSSEPRQAPDNYNPIIYGHQKVRPSIHMPRWASRVDLEITSVRVERLQDISEADAMAEGCEAIPFPGPWWQGYRADDEGELHHQQTVSDAPPEWMIEPKRMKPMNHLDRSARDAFRQLWMHINSADSWNANPWVWVVEFKQLKGGAA